MQIIDKDGFFAIEWYICMGTRVTQMTQRKWGVGDKEILRETSC